MGCGPLPTPALIAATSSTPRGRARRHRTWDQLIVARATHGRPDAYGRITACRGRAEHGAGPLGPPALARLHLGKSPRGYPAGPVRSGRVGRGDIATGTGPGSALQRA